MFTHVNIDVRCVVQFISLSATIETTYLS